MIRIADGSVIPGGTATASNNIAGCNALTEINNTCLFSVEITQDSDVPADLSARTKILGNLTIKGDITTFPDFSALKVVEGSISISDLSDATLTALNNIFPVLDSVRGNLVIHDNNEP